MRFQPRALRPAPSLLLALALGAFSCARPEAPALAPPPASAPGEDAISKLNVGTRLLEQLLPADAAKRFEEALVLHPAWLPATVDLAIARMNILDPAMDEAAATAAQDALALAPDDPRAQYVLAYIRAERQRRFPDAATLLRSVVKSTPGDANAWYQLGRAAHEQVDDAGDAATPATAALRAEAEAAYRKALELDATLAEANYKLGRLLLDSTDPAKQKEGEAVLARHEAILKGRPAVQQNYYRRGALALVYPFTPERPPVPAPSPVAFLPQAPLDVPPFQSQHEAPGLSAVRWRDGLSLADLNGDGRLDVIAPMRDEDQPMLLTWLQSVDGSFAPPKAMGPQGHACSSAPMGDLDRDGDLDALVACNTGNVLLKNLGDGMLALAPQAEMDWPAVAGMASTLVDVDHDGDLDLHVVGPLEDRPPSGSEPGGWRGTQFIWRNDGAGAFTPVTGAIGLNVELDSHQFIWADIDGDNAVDLVESVTGSGLCVARNDRSEKFTIAPIGAPATKAGLGPPALVMTALDVDADA